MNVSSNLKSFYLLLLLCWALIAYAGLGQMLASNTMFARKISGKVAITDFVNVYNAGLLSKRSLSGTRVDIYDPQVQSSSQERLIAPVKPDFPFYLQYPPWFFALMLPLSATDSMQLAYCAWTAAGLAGLVFCLFYLLRQTQFSRSAKVLSFVSVMVSYPTWLSFGMGQTSLFNFTVMIAALLLLQKHKFSLAGVVSALVAVKMQYAPVICVVGAMLGRSRFVFGFALGMIVLVVYSLAVLGLDNMIAWPRALFMGETSSQVSGVSPVTMQCLRGYLTLLLTGVKAEVTAGIALIGFIAGLLAVARLWWHIESTEQTFKYATSLTFLLMMITSMHTHVYDYVMMAVPAIWLFDLNTKNDSHQGKALRALILIYPLTSWAAARLSQTLAAAYIRFDLFWAVALLILGFLTWQQSRRHSLTVADTSTT